MYGILLTGALSIIFSIHVPRLLGLVKPIVSTMDGDARTATGIGKEDTEKLTHACAEACGVGRGIVAKICPASGEQVHRMEHHIKTGSYMMQMVLHYEGGVLDQDFLLRVVSGLRFKNHILRTRLVKYEGQVYQVVLKDSFTYRQVDTTRIDVFLAQNSQVRMGYGTPLLRYAFIRDPHGESFFVWSGEPLQIPALELMY